MRIERPQRVRIEIRGAVQGVGFRPFVYRLAADLGLTGWVINDSRGVFIEAEGAPAHLDDFVARVRRDHPPHARIQEMTAERLPPVGFSDFQIRHSDDLGPKTVLVLPDLATCPACLAEVLDPSNRRHAYAFTNCTDCGPRFTIVQALPYDRPNTTMSGFPLCPACHAEYTDPLNRRFHAQPNACGVCGPSLAFGANGEWRMANGEALEGAVAALKAGQIVAVKGLGGFHLMVDATNAAAVQRLRDRKPRPHKPLAIMVRDVAQAGQVAIVSRQAESLLLSAQAPILLLKKAEPSLVLAHEVAPGNPNIGIMVASTPLHHLLLRAVDGPLVATSGNLSDEPICIDNADAQERLGHIADAFLTHNRPIARHVDDSVLWIVDGQPQFLRRARGYAPLPVVLPRPAPTILAVGAHLKNTVALSVGRNVFLSQHIGDLESADSLAAFHHVIADFLKLYEATPAAIAHDLHPDYLSTKWAKDQGLGIGDWGSGTAQSPIPNPQSLIPVQHHHAHLAACLADNGVDGPALGIIWDGTGYGPDGTIWGGEFLLGDAAGYERVGHLRPFRLPGGDAAVRQPKRTALALLWEILGDDVFERTDLSPIQAMTATERRVLGQMLRKGINAPLTTSAGRLFDGIAALIGLRQEVTFEGQAAMQLEYAADPHETGAYPFALTNLPISQSPNPQSPIPNPLLLDWQPTITAILSDLRQGVEPGIMSGRFHNGLVAAAVAVAQAVGDPRIALSGGCFQNRRLTEQMAQALRAAGFEVLLHRQVPPNDGGISLGQVAVAAAQLK